MGKSLLAVFLACFFFAGGTIFPLGDFSLMKELPRMYQSYAKIAVEETDVIDFVGDYILNGKDLLGHNEHDYAPKSDSSLQFRHQASLMLVAFWPVKTALPLLAVPVKKLFASHPLTFPTSYANKLFRPPLA